MEILDRLVFQKVLIDKALEWDKTIEEYCHPNTDYMVVNKETDMPSLTWDGKYDFVVYGDYAEAKADSIETDKIVRVVTWLKRNNIINSNYQLAKIKR